jgi:hypothetical protein
MGQSASSLESLERDTKEAAENGEGKSKQPKSLSEKPRRSSSLLAQFKDVSLPPVTLASPNEWKQAFRSLSDVELQELILSAPVSERDVKFMAARIVQQGMARKNKVKEPENAAKNEGISFHDTDDNDRKFDESHHFYVTSAVHLTKRGKCGGTNPDQSEDELTALCFRILRVSPTMAKLRFRLVPTKLEEHLFWQALWTIFYETLRQQEDDEEELDISRGGTNTVSNKTTPGRFLLSPFSSPENDDAEVDREFADFSRKRAEETIFTLRRTIEKQEWKIEELQKQLKVLKNQSTSVPTIQAPTVAQTLSSKSKPSSNTHNGTWVMDSDSQDFMEYPKELKENLRAEKRKRLKEVMEQMKFILDSDNVEDTNGAWNCCGQTQYQTVCLKAHK